MSRRVPFILVISLLCIAVAVFLFMKNRINLSSVESVEVLFVYENIELCEHVDEQGLLIIKDIFDGKCFFNDNLSCGFSENISLRINDEYTFCFARDMCPILYWKENGVYIRLSEKEYEKLYTLVKDYGVFFPCF